MILFLTAKGKWGGERVSLILFHLYIVKADNHWLSNNLPTIYPIVQTQAPFTLTCPFASTQRLRQVLYRVNSDANAHADSLRQRINNTSWR